jgi:hypothetical protein
MVKNSSLPHYIVYNPLNEEPIPPILAAPCDPLPILLSPDDIRDIQLLECKFDEEKNCVGLAGPQIGIHKPIIQYSFKMKVLTFNIIFKSSFSYLFFFVRTRLAFKKFMMKNLLINMRYNSTL